MLQGYSLGSAEFAVADSRSFVATISRPRLHHRVFLNLPSHARIRIWTERKGVVRTLIMLLVRVVVCALL